MMQIPLLRQKKFKTINAYNKISISKDLASLLNGVWHDRLTDKAIVLSYLAARNFKVVRFPTRPDRSVDGKGNGFNKAVELLDNYSDRDLDQLAGELQRATDATQQFLRSNFGDAPILLQRAVAPLSEKNGQYVSANRSEDPIETFALLGEAARQANLNKIELDFDIVSGWSPCALARYGTLHLQRYWQIEDILLVSDLLAGPSGSQPLENDEWLCINQNPRGILSIASCDYKVVGLPKEYLKKINNLICRNGQGRIKDLALKLQEEVKANPTCRGICPRPPSELTNLNAPAFPAQPFFSKIKDCWRILSGKPFSRD